MLSLRKEAMMPNTVDRKMLRSWSEELEALGERLSVHFARSEVRQRANDYLRGLLSEAERKNSWQLAEVAGNSTPYGLQHLLGRANWDADAVRDNLREYVLQHLAGEEESVLVVDETGFIKKGDKSAGVKRQYTGTVGKRENCQVGVFLAYASERGQAFIDRELYLPEEWASDEHRRERAGVPEEVGMRTKPELAKEMLLRALDAGVQAGWVLADSVYGDSRPLGMCSSKRRSSPMCAGSLGQGSCVVRLLPAPSKWSTRSPARRRIGGRGKLGAPFVWGRLEGSASLRLVEAAAQSPDPGRFPEMAFGAPLHRGPGRDQCLHGLRPREHHPPEVGEGGWQPLAGGDRI